MLKKNLLLGLLAAVFLATGCARSGTDDVAILEESLKNTDETVAANSTGTSDNAEAIGELDTRVTTLEDEEPAASGVPQGVIDDVAELGTDLADLDTRVTTLEGKWPPVDNDVLIDDKAAAGFPEAVSVTNVEEGMAYMNSRMDAQSGRLTTLETTITNVVGGAATTAVAVSVNDANLNPTGYGNVQESVESLYTKAYSNASAITALQAASSALNTASGISFDNSGHAAFDNNNVTSDVQAAVEDVHEKIQSLVSDIANIGANGVSTTAANVTYGNNNQATVEAALDDLYLSMVNITILANGTYIAQGQDLNVAIAALDAALTTTNTAVGANTAAIAQVANDLAALDGNLDDRINALIDARVAALIADRIQPLEDALADLQNRAATPAYILGVSTDSTTGKINFNGVQGARGATAMCQATYADDATAHLCSPAEVQGALATGGYDAATANFSGVETWTISGLTVEHGTVNVYSPNADSLAASCNNLSYNSADVAKGVTLRAILDAAGFGVGGAGAVSDVYRLQPARACGTSLPVLCCR